MNRFDTIDLSQLPAPQVVEKLDFDTYKAQLLADFTARAEEAGFPYDAEWLEGQTGFLESDPVVLLMEVAAYREQILRQRVNDAARAIMLAFSTGGNLQNLGAFYKVKKLEGESDARYKLRVQLAPEALASTGTEGGYAFYALGADVSIKDVRVTAPNEGDGHVHILPLVDTGDGTPSADILNAVRAAILDAKDANGRRIRKQLTDIIVVRAPTVVNYSIDVDLVIPSDGPSREPIVSQASAAVEAYRLSRHKIGRPVYRAGIMAAAKVGGVENVIVNQPVADIAPGDDGVAYATSVVVE